MASETLSYAVRPRVVGIYLGQLAFLVGCLSTPSLVFAAIEREWMAATGYLIAVVALAGGGSLFPDPSTAAFEFGSRVPAPSVPPEKIWGNAQWRSRFP